MRRHFQNESVQDQGNGTMAQEGLTPNIGADTAGQPAASSTPAATDPANTGDQKIQS